ncbi:MAG: glucose-6-phosphate isomerase, partial [Xanthomonadales bacterium]|nr:glucose-6-phosphate isomerase [Xanthomonadales bacterium]NIX11517.1 glucose-6-phosphate isomerase [Xanthomonadales bacterium]
MLRKCNKDLQATSLAELLKEPGRFNGFSRSAAGLTLDFSRTRLDTQALEALLALARECAMEEAREQLFSGRAVNATEGRAAMHMALRDPGLLDASGLADASRAADSLKRLRDLAGTLHEGRLPGSGEGPVTDIVHVGIGGSLLGTRLVCEALGEGAGGPRVHFLGSVDAHSREALLPNLDPGTTAVVVVSKSFTTADTMMHAERLFQWLEGALGTAEAWRRMFAVAGDTERAGGLGYLPGQVLYLPQWVGGRYSLWSAVSLSAAALIGPGAFDEMTAGAAAMDRHFLEAGLADNLPVLTGLVGFWHRSICNYPAWGVIPYDQRLRSLPAHLQQLIMESNGKAVTAAGEPVRYGTAPVVFGETGTEAQHSLFQALHQGPDIVPVQLLGVIRPDHDDTAAHDELLANLLAQATALATGRSEEETRRQLAAGGGGEQLLAHRGFSGDRPSEILLLDRLTPGTVGSLLAFYEHKVFVESVLWGINAFDQWGVELGKQLAPGIRVGLETGETDAPGMG